MPTDRRTFLKQTAVWSLAAWPTVVTAQEPKPKPKPDPYRDAVLVGGEAPLPAAGSFCIAVLPDTQHYSEKHPHQFLAQTRWIAEQKQKRNIACVLHLGDITNRNTPAEWKNAAQAMHQLDGIVPYFMCPGNHDYSDGGVCKDRTTLLNTYFPFERCKEAPTFGGVYDKEPQSMENSYHLFAVGGREFLVLALEFGPRMDVVRWANQVVAKHARREAILITHAFIYSDETRYNWKKYGGKQAWNPHSYRVARASNDDVSDGEELWERLISKHENFVLTLNGHVLNDGLGQYHSATPGGRNVPQVLVNFQMKPKGGDGWLRLLEFKADGRTVEAYDYSPTRNQCNHSPQNRFALKLAPVGK